MRKAKGSEPLLEVSEVDGEIGVIVAGGEGALGGGSHRFGVGELGADRGDGVEKGDGGGGVGDEGFSGEGFFGGSGGEVLQVEIALRRKEGDGALGGLVLGP